jgi:hypothetical protein
MIIAFTTTLGLDHGRDTLFNAVCHRADQEFGGRYLRIDYPFSQLRPFAQTEQVITPLESLENDWGDVAKRHVLIKLARAKKEGRDVIMNDNGHGIMQRAAFYRAHGDLRQAEHVHHGTKVPEIVKPLGLGVPWYLRLSGTPGEIAQAMLACPGRNPRVLERKLPTHIAAQLAESARYFSPAFGQRYRDVSLTLPPPDRVDAAMSYIRELVRTHARRAA